MCIGPDQKDSFIQSVSQPVNKYLLSIYWSLGSRDIVEKKINKFPVIPALPTPKLSL